MGNLSDCVRVDGSSGPCYDPSLAPAFVDYETPGGVLDGSNATFTLASAPSPATSLCLYRNGLKLQAGSDFNLQPDGSILFVAGVVPQAGDVLYASYRTSGDESYDQLAASRLAQAQTPKVQILCSGTGSGTGNTNYTSLASCLIPAGTLSPGDRVEVRFNFLHQGSAISFNFRAQWGSTTLVQRSAAAADMLVTGHGDAVAVSGGANLDVQTWGTVLPLDSRVALSSDALTADLEIDLQGAMSASGADMVYLQNYTVLRYPVQ
jgi:hypothetical protein